MANKQSHQDTGGPVGAEPERAPDQAEVDRTSEANAQEHPRPLEGLSGMGPGTARVDNRDGRSDPFVEFGQVETSRADDAEAAEEFDRIDQGQPGEDKGASR
jgi:hypothetical protein